MRGEIFHLKFRSSSPERMTRIGSSSPDDWDLRGNTDTLTMTRGAAVAACEARNARCKKKGACPHRRACEEQNRRGAKSGPARVEFRISPARSKSSPRASGISNFDKNCASRGAPRWVHPSHTTGCEAGGERCGDICSKCFRPDSNWRSFACQANGLTNFPTKALIVNEHVHEAARPGPPTICG